MSQFLLEMNAITKEFPGVKALDGVTLRLQPGKVHALMGENGAGKSTLMKCLFGIYAKDSGEVVFQGEKVEIKTPRQAMDLGIAMIHQELYPVVARSVMENLWLGRFPLRRFGPLTFVDHKKMEEDSTKLFAKLGLSIDPRETIGNLSVSKIQAIEIAKAVSANAKVIVMDEPTSSLTGPEVEKLFSIIADLKKQGVAIVYISHKMEEILRISDDVTIMRDGRLVGTWPASELTIDDIVKRMVGRELDQRFPAKDNNPKDLVLEVQGLTSSNPRSFKDISFSLRSGEILGISGLVGSQRTELVETIFGLRGKKAGRILIKGQEKPLKSPKQAISNKLALLTEERRATGIFPTWSVLENTVVANQQSYLRFGLLSDKKRRRDTEDNIKSLRIKTPSADVQIKNLSGGNQQKVLLARWLLLNPDVLILDEPTRGIDVGAKHEIYTIIVGLAKQGKSVIVISSEMPELLGLSDRILVMCEGRLTGELSRAEANEEEIMRLATKFQA